MRRCRPNALLGCVLSAAIVLAAVLSAACAQSVAADLLDGEFGPIDLGRKLVEPDRMPTIRELRELVRQPRIIPVLMLKLFGNDKNYHLPAWSGDGQRLAFQRSELDVKSSKLLMYAAMAQAEPTLLSDEADAYDYMFRWSVNQPAGYAFVRIHGAGRHQLFVADEGGKPRSSVPEEGRYAFPAIYRRTDGISRLVYQQDGEVIHRAWNARGPVEPPLALLRGAAPCWSQDGSRLLVARQRPGRDSNPVYDIVVWNLRSQKETLLPAGVDGIVRSPVWAPDERYAAFYVRDFGDGKPWRIRACPGDPGAEGRTLGENVVVNLTFETAGPAWEPSSRRLWFFSEAHRQQAYYPMVAADVHTGELAIIDYPSRFTNPNDLAMNPRSAVPEIAFVAHDGLPQDLFIVFMNHY